MEKRSLYREAVCEFRRVCDEDPSDYQKAASEWNRKHWWAWSRKRWLEHIKGEVFWVELGEKEFGWVKEHDLSNTSILSQILQKIHDGEENLDIINWALELDEDLDEVLRILSRLDLNKSRLEMRNAMS